MSENSNGNQPQPEDLAARLAEGWRQSLGTLKEDAHELKRVLCELEAALDPLPEGGDDAIQSVDNAGNGLVRLRVEIAELESDLRQGRRSLARLLGQEPQPEELSR